VSGSEYCPKNYQAGQRESPESKVFPNGAHRTFGATGQEQGNVSGDS
jgi:hypothetical protein